MDGQREFIGNEMNGFQFKRQQRSEVGTVKVVINRCFGGFGLSGDAWVTMRVLTGVRVSLEGLDHWS